MNDLIKYHNNFIQAIYSTDIISKKLLIGISHKIQKINKYGEEVQFNIKELAELTGINDNSLRNIRKSINKLQTTIILAENPLNDEWVSFQIFGEASYKNSKLTVKISKYMKPFLSELNKKFTKYHIENIKPLKSEYSIRIYEMISQFKNTGIFRINIDELKNKLQINNKYKLFNNFKKRVLEHAKDELKKNSDLYFDYKINMIGTKANSITFNIHKQQIYKDSKLSKKDYEDIYNTERGQAINKLMEPKPTKEYLNKYNELYGYDKDYNYESDGSPKDMLYRFMINEHFLNFPSFEEWYKKIKNEEIN